MARAMHELRRVAFWCLDKARGGAVSQAYRELRAFDAMDSRSTEIMEHQHLALQQLMNHAVATTRFYGGMREGPLAQFPVINKNVIRTHQEDFMSNKYDRSRLVTMATSGSTGTPFVCYQNPGKKKRVNAEIIYYSEKAGYSVGGKLIFLRALTEESRKSRLQQWIQNETLLDISRLDDEHIEQLLRDIEKASRREGAMILAYASTYDAFKDYFRRRGHGAIRCTRVDGIVSSSEMLFDGTREAMERAFGCRCFSRYSNQENGVIGQDDVQNNVFVLNEAHYIIETLKMDSDAPATEDEVGRIVITDLYNYAMPMIRYDTGDIGSIVRVVRNGIEKKALADFGGRRVDVVLDCRGNRLSPHSITNRLWSFPEIRQYQFVQESQTQYTVIMSVDHGFARQGHLTAALLELLGAEADIRICLVDEIPVLASGKRKYIVNRTH